MSERLTEWENETVVSHHIFTEKLVKADLARQTFVETQMKKMNNKWENSDKNITNEDVFQHPVQQANIASSSLLTLWSDYNPNPGTDGPVGWLNDNVCFSFSIKRNNRLFVRTCLGHQFHF